MEANRLYFVDFGEGNHRIGGDILVSGGDRVRCDHAQLIGFSTGTS